MTGRGPLRPSCTCTRGQGPWTPLGDIASLEEKTASASFAGVTESLWASGPRKQGKIPGGERAFPLGFFQAFTGCFASGKATLSAGSIVASPHSGHCSFRLISPPMKFPPQAVIGGSSGPEAITSPSRLSFQSTACVRSLVRLTSILLRGVQGDHPPGQVWAESPAFPLCTLLLPFTQIL